jgi:hypothetical protein
MKTKYCVSTVILKDDGFTVVEEFGSGEFVKFEGAILETIKNLTWTMIERQIKSKKKSNGLAIDLINGTIDKVLRIVEAQKIIVDTTVNK